MRRRSPNQPPGRVAVRRLGRPAVAAAAVVLVACAGIGRGARLAPSSSGDYVQTTYDPEADTTRVRTTPVRVAGNLEMYAGFSFAGETLTRTPQEVRLVFQETSTGLRWQDPRGRALFLVLDDTARITVEETEYRRHVLTGRGPVTAKVTEWVWATVPTETLQRIASASRAEGTLATTRFSLTPEHLAVLRQLLRQMSAQGAPGVESPP
jgi:hypothetical protein